MRCRVLKDPPAIQWSCALYSYASSARLIVRAWKFGRHPMLTHFVARALVRPVLRIQEAFPQRNFVIVPAPSSPGRWKRTGREPLMLAARELSRRTGLPLASVLARDCSRSQKTLDRKGREANLRGKLRCTKEAVPHVILIDDVITTGATLRSCARALLAAGTETLCCLAFCYD